MEEMYKYGQTMKEIKMRMMVIDSYLTGTREAIFAITTAESICLQFRKIFELILLSSLTANKNQYR